MRRHFKVRRLGGGSAQILNSVVKGLSSTNFEPAPQLEQQHMASGRDLSWIDQYMVSYVIPPHLQLKMIQLFSASCTCPSSFLIEGTFYQTPL